MIATEAPVSAQPTRLPTGERQALIVAAAIALTAHTEPAAVTTTDIARAVGVTQGALFKHFASRDAIWLAVMQWVRETLLPRLHAAAQSTRADEPVVNALQRVFDTHVAFVLAHPGVPRLVFHELQQPADSPPKAELAALLGSYRALVAGLLQSAHERGETDPELDRDAAARLFIGMVQGLAMQWLLAGAPPPEGLARAQADGFFNLYRRSLRPLP
jgi:AcrR family transcriptional regulator